jgi:hypothetical protein
MKYGAAFHDFGAAPSLGAMYGYYAEELNPIGGLKN